MHVQWDLLLSELGCKISKSTEDLQPCPLHFNNYKDTLSITNGLVSTHFNCSYKHCKFKSGNAIDLVACVKNISPEKAYKLFTRGGILYHTRKDISELQHQEAYNNSKSSQDYISKYIYGCHNALKSVEGCLLHSRWSELGYCSPNTDLPNTFGALIAKDLPPQLYSLQGKAYKDNFAIHAYTYDNCITAVSLRSALDPDAQKITQLNNHKIGVYPEPLGDLETIFLVQDERLATQIYSNVRTFAKEPFPVFTTLGIPLPPEFKDTKNIYILDCPNAPLSIHTALNYLCSDNIIENGFKPKVNVISYRKSPDIQQLQSLRQTRQKKPNAISLDVWIARKIKQLETTEGIDFIAQLFQNRPDLGDKKENFLGALRKECVSDDILDIVSEQFEKPKTCVILTNNNVVYKTPHGFRGGRSINSPATIRLSNFTWEIVEELLDKEDNIWYRCKLYLDTLDSYVHVELKHQDFETKNKLIRAISTELGKHGISNKAVAYSVHGFDWIEIRDAFKKDTKVVKEVEHFGVDANLDVHLPGMIITHNGKKLIPQNRVLNIPKNISSLYAGIDYRTKSAKRLAPILDLWSGNTIEEAGLSLGISHVIYCIIQDLLCKRDNITPPLQHLCFADPMRSTWAPVCKQLASIFSGAPRINSLPGFRGAKYKTYFNELSGLGSLPWIAELPESKTLATIIRDIPVNIIGLTDDVQASTISNLNNVAFAALDRVPLVKLDFLAPNKISNIRAAIPELIQLSIVAAHNLNIDQWNAEQPAHDTYYGIANLFDGFNGYINRAPVNMITRKYYIPYTTSMLHKFFEGLRKYVHFSKGDKSIRQIFGTPNNKKRGGAVYIMDDLVLIDKALINTFNNFTNARVPLSVPMVTKELIENKYIMDVAPGRVSIDLDRFWAISRELWEEKVTGSLFSKYHDLKILQDGPKELKLVG